MSAATESRATASIPVPKAVRSRFTLPPMAAFVGTAIAFAGLYLAAGAPSPLFVQYQQEWGFPAGLLTIAFAAYAFALVVALLFFGSLSDFIGRRPVLIGALLVELGSMVMFLFAPSIGWIIAARVVQGLATGAATSTFSASLLELAPEKARRVAAIIGGAARCASVAGPAHPCSRGRTPGLRRSRPRAARGLDVLRPLHRDRADDRQRNL
jgi:MFS family permease